MAPHGTGILATAGHLNGPPSGSDCSAPAKAPTATVALNDYFGSLKFFGNTVIVSAIGGHNVLRALHPPDSLWKRAVETPGRSIPGPARTEAPEALAGGKTRPGMRSSTYIRVLGNP
jgi:hypothetical protein